MNISANRPVMLGLFILLLAFGLYQSVSDLSDGQEVDPVEAPDFENRTQDNTVQDSSDSSDEERSSQDDEPTIEEIRQNKSERYRKARPLTDPDGFINTDEVSIEENIGEKVILLDMWTYSCINCQRVIPHLNEWHRKYSDDGLLIIGNHAPEFEFEKDRSNVQEAVDRFNVSYPVVLDNDKQTWDAYNNRYWPQKYLIGVDGYIRYEHIGEGSYDQTEQKIVELLKEKNERLGINSTVDADSEEERNSEDVNHTKIKTPEIYFGAFWDQKGIGTPRNEKGVYSYSIPEEADRDRAYLEGNWNVTSEYARGTEGDRIKLDYTAKEVNMVLKGEDAVVRVRQDGEIIENHGEDVENGLMDVSENMLYKIAENPDYGNHTIELEVVEGQLDAYTFTFG